MIPYTESLRMAEHLRASSDLRVTITPLFAHSRGQRGAGFGGMWDELAFVRTLGQLLRLV
jgi:hypothetical protein